MTTQDYQRKSPLAIFFHYFGNHRRLFAIDLGCAVGMAAIDMAFPLVTRQALYDYLPNEAYGVFFRIMVLVAASYVLRTFLNYIVTYYGHTFGIRVEAENRTGKLMSRLTTDLFELTELAHHGPEDLLTSVLTILGALAVMASIRWQLALVVALTIPVFLTVAMTMRQRMEAITAAGSRPPTRFTRTPSGASTRPWACSRAAWNSSCVCSTCWSSASAAITLCAGKWTTGISSLLICILPPL